MARLWSCGFELQSAVNGVEIDGQGGTGINIDTTIKRSGAASMRILRSDTPGTSYVGKQFSSGLSKVIARIYLRIATAPNTETGILEFGKADQATFTILTLSSDRKLRFYYTKPTGQWVLLGTSAVLDLDTWYRIETYADITNNNCSYQARLNGVTFASASGVSDAYDAGNASIQAIFWGIDAGGWGSPYLATADLYFDDIAVNDTTGSYQNSWPGSGLIAHLKPNAAGDNNMFAKGDAVDTGFQNPSSHGAVYADWANGQNAYASDDQRATVTPGAGQTKRHDWGTFGFSIPAGSIISGIEMSIERYQSWLTDQNGVAYLSWDGGSSWTSGKTVVFPIAEATASYGSSSDTWGRTWSASDFNNGNFLVRVDSQYYIGETYYIDHIQIKIYYQPGGDANNYQNVDEITPDDATTYLEAINNNDVDDYNCEAASVAEINAFRVITLVQVGLRHRAETASAGSLTPRIKSQAAGTVQSGTTFTHNDVTWKTNGDDPPNVYKLTSYVDPQAAGPWTPALLDTMQIGVIAPDATPDMWVSTIWALVEYTSPKKTISAKALIRKLGVTKTVTAKSAIKIPNITKTVEGKGFLVYLRENTVEAKARIKRTEEKTISAKAILSCIGLVTLVSPTDGAPDQPTTLYLVWQIPTDCENRNIHAHVQVDKTDDTFNDLEKDLFSYRDSGFEYWDGDFWEPYPAGGVGSAYYGNQARVQVTLVVGTKYWRVRGAVG